MLDDVDDLMPIGQFSERSGLSPKRLRSYAAAGLLVPAAVDSASGYRYYAPGQLREARLIDALRGAGVPLAEIATVLRDPSAGRLDAWARQVEVHAARRQEALRLARRLLAVDGDTRASALRSRKDGTMNLRTAARTDIGHVRESNQDAVLCLDRLVAVADGMGGQPGGDIASSLALTFVEATFTGRSIEELGAGVRAANRAIFERASEVDQPAGMGTTLCAVGVTEEGALAVVNVGDSRAYLVRDGALRRLTEDHSIAADLVRRGELTEKEAVHHPHRGVLTRAVGVGPTVEVDAVTESAVAGDRVLLCTDGLFNEVPEEQMRSLVDAGQGPDRVADALVNQALSNGGRDNVAVVIADVLA
jgi:serine/threonine protein phosphatase PrpC